MKHFVLSLLVVIISACGWQLRGIIVLPPSVQLMTLESQASNRFNQRLRQQLEFNGVTFPTDASASVRLQIEPILIERLTLSVNNVGQAAEFELNATLNAHLIELKEDGKDISWELTGRRIFNNDVNSVIGTESEETIQRQELENDLIRKLMIRLQKADL
jgi:LPS-assembly lipoprotein